MASKNQKLVESFNSAAKPYKDGALNSHMFAIHYFAAMRHGTSSEDEKKLLTETLFESVTQRLLACANKGNTWVFASDTAEDIAKPVLEALAAPEARVFLSPQAPLHMADIVNQASQTSASTTWRDFSGNDGTERLKRYQQQITRLAELALNYADVFASPLPEASVETAKDITPVRRITLKQGEGPSTP